MACADSRRQPAVPGRSGCPPGAFEGGEYRCPDQGHVHRRQAQVAPRAHAGRVRDAAAAARGPGAVVEQFGGGRQGGRDSLVVGARDHQGGDLVEAGSGLQQAREGAGAAQVDEGLAGPQALARARGQQHKGRLHEPM